MAFVQTADDMVDNSIKVLSDVLDSKFTSFLQGNGTPVLVTYYNIDSVTSTANPGDGTIDKILGEDSPLRYNKIENLPVVGLREILPSIEEVEGQLLDMSFEGEVILFPNTITPCEYDYILYEFPDKSVSITFLVTNVEMSTIKSNSYYKVSIALKDINDYDTVDKLDNQLAGNYKANLDNVGTQDKCVIKNTVFDEIELIKKVMSYICEQYIDIFYNRQYNCMICKPDKSDYIIYDPYITKFINNNAILDLQSTYFIQLSEYDTRYDVLKMYNSSLYHNLEIGDCSRLRFLKRLPVSFETTLTNPFSFYGEDIGFTLDLVESDDLMAGDTMFYFPKNLIERIKMNQILIDGDFAVDDNNRVVVKKGYVITDDVIENVSVEDEEPSYTKPEDIFPKDGSKYSNIYWNLIITYLNKHEPINLLKDSKFDINQFLHIILEHNYETFIYSPIVLFILDKYVKFLINH